MQHDNTQSDYLEISALRIDTRIGVHAWEQRILQTVLIDLRIPLTGQKKPDRLETTIDYASLSQQVVTAVQANSFQLIESLAEFIANWVKTQYQITNVLSVRVSKPHAIPSAGNISVSIER